MAVRIRIYKRPAVQTVCILAALTLSRLFLIALHWDRVAPTNGVGFILLQGVRFDLILVAGLLGPIFLLKPWFHTWGPLRRAGNWIIAVYAGVATALIFFVEASTVSFIAEFDSRPNYLFVEYMEYPHQVLATLTGTNLPELVGFTALAVLIGWIVARWLRRDPRSGMRISFGFCILATPVTFFLMAAMIRSTTDHRPLNPSNAAFSGDAMVNQLPLNSPYSVLHAIYEHRKEVSSKEVRYGEMTEKEVLSIILKEAGIAEEDQLDPAAPTLHRQVATVERDEPLNLVIVLEESLGAIFVGSLGGMDLTPNLDALADQGIWFERLYATGLRSARGIEAVITGFTPSPQTNVVKRSDTQDNFFTIASLLESHGYSTSFIYGGESHFDNMRRFFLNNGFQTVIDENDYENPVFRGAWGVSDEDLFARAHEELSKMGDQRFFSLIFTSSHHAPFDIPHGRVAESAYGPRESSIKYADYALGRFIHMARHSDYWDNTVFLIVADHGDRLFARQLVPVERYRIPGVIIGPTIEPRRISGITSQIDIVPTLLSLIGLDTDHPGIGRDLTRPEYADGAGRAMLQYHVNHAFFEEERIVVLQPDLEPASFFLRPNGEMVPDPKPDPELERKALAHALWGQLMIKNGAYRH